MDIKQREITVGWSLVPLAVMIIAMILAIVVFKGEPHIRS